MSSSLQIVVFRSHRLFTRGVCNARSETRQLSPSFLPLNLSKCTIFVAKMKKKFGICLMLQCRCWMLYFLLKWIAKKFRLFPLLEIWHWMVRSKNEQLRFYGKKWKPSPRWSHLVNALVACILLYFFPLPLHNCSANLLMSRSIIQAKLVSNLICTANHSC